MTRYTIALALLLAGCKMPTAPGDVKKQVTCADSPLPVRPIYADGTCPEGMSIGSVQMWKGLESCGEADRYTDPKTVEVCTWVM